MPNDTPVLQCAACGHQNEPERVYCHNCGQKLDRSLLPQAQEAAKESPEAVRRRVKKMMDVKGKGAFKNAVKTFFQVVVGAAALSAAYLYFQKPEGVPPRKSEYFPNALPADVWLKIMESNQPLAHEFSEDDLNYFLRTTLKPADSSIPGIKFERAFVYVQEGTISVTVERSLFGTFDLYSTTKYAPRNTGDAVKWEPVAIYFGKLGVDPRIPGVAGLGLGGVETALKKEIGQFGRLRSVEAREIQAMVDGAPQRRGMVKFETKAP